MPLTVTGGRLRCKFWKNHCNISQLDTVDTVLAVINLELMELYTVFSCWGCIGFGNTFGVEQVWFSDFQDCDSITFRIVIPGLWEYSYVVLTAVPENVIVCGNAGKLSQYSKAGDVFETWYPLRSVERSCVVMFWWTVASWVVGLGIRRWNIKTASFLYWCFLGAGYMLIVCIVASETYKVGWCFNIPGCDCCGGSYAPKLVPHPD